MTRVPWWPWQRRQSAGADPLLPRRVRPADLLLAVQTVQADVRRLGAAAVRAETQTQGLAARLDGIGTQVAAGLEQLTRQASRLANAQDVAATERKAVLTRFLDLGDALARARLALEEPLLEETGAVPGIAPLLQHQRAACADALDRLRAQFTRTVGDFGCEPVAVPGAPFDPRVHRAIARVVEPSLAGRVAMVAREGWLLDGRLLRVADVVVAMEGGPAGVGGPGEAGDGADGRGRAVAGTEGGGDAAEPEAGAPPSGHAAVDIGGEQAGTNG